MISVTWYRHGHEARNDYLRWSLVRLADAGRIAYRERPQAAGAEAGMSAGLVAHEHRHTSVLSIEDGPRRRLVAIDNEDGFTHLQPFVDEVDAYFCCPFTSAFHREKSFPDPLPWQTEADVADYRAQAARLVERHGDHFDKVRPLVPTPTQMVVYESFTPTERRGVLWAHRVRKAAVWRADRELWRHEMAACEARYRQMTGYRALGLRHDVVSRESLWGWPENRVALHERLHGLAAAGRDVHAQLTAPEPEALAGLSEASRARLPALTAPMRLDEPFEAALCSSRLAVFPTGFHWGWRGITFVALCAGVPVLMDRPTYEPYFPWSEFDVFTNEGRWETVGDLLREIDEARWLAIKAHTQRVFDARLSPDAVGAYLLGQFSDLLTA